MLAKKEFKVLYEHTASERVAPAAATATTVRPAKKPAPANGKTSTAPTFVTHKADVDLYADMRANRTIPQCSAEAQKFCDGVSLAAPLWSVPVEEARRRYATVLTPSLPKLSVLSAANVFAEGRHGQVPVRLYKPDGSLGKTLPMTFFFHGGGWVLGGIDSHDYFCRDLCRRSGKAVIAVDYRLSPEHRFPVPLDDCVDAVKWCVKFSKRLNLDPTKATFVGDSAGGTLALTTAIVLRDERLKRAERAASDSEGSEAEAAEPELVLKGVVAMYPPLDAYMGSYSQVNYPAFGLPRDVRMFFRDSYAKEEHAGSPSNPLVSPVYADLKGLPPVHLMSAECDGTIDECAVFMQRLKEAGVAVSQRVYSGQIHGFITLPMQFPAAVGEALTDLIAELNSFTSVTAPATR